MAEIIAWRWTAGPHRRSKAQLAQMRRERLARARELKADARRTILQITLKKK